MTGPDHGAPERHAALPALPDISPNTPHVAFVMLECRACGTQSPWTRDDDGTSDHAWSDDHWRGTGHRRYHVFTLTRNTLRVMP